MRKQNITLAALLALLVPLTAAAQAAIVAAPATAVQRSEDLPSVADEVQGMEPVYAPRDHFGGPYYPGQAPAPGGGPDGYADFQSQPCGNDGCCCKCCCGPCWEVRAAGVVLRRNNPDNVPFLTLAGVVEAFNLAQFNFDYEPGVDVSVIGHINPCVSVEGRYLALFDANDQVFAGPFPATAAIIDTTPPTLVGLGAGSTIDANYRSELNSGEINLRARAIPWLNLLGGFRYLDLRERFQADITSDPVTGQVLQWETRVRNQLYGMQLGAEANLFSGRGGCYSVGGFVKGGIYAVHAEHDASLSQNILPPLFFSGSASDTQAAFVGEAGVNASFQVTRYLSVTAGYQIIWLEGVAVASDQIPVTGAPVIAPIGPLSPTRIDVDGHVFYHGIKAGVELRF